jgi:hypothetical protein
MDATEVLSLAAALRAYALESGRDLNAANLFTHTMLMRSLAAEKMQPDSDEDFDFDAG